MSRMDVFARWAAIERATGARIGAARPRDEPVRFAPSTGLEFPAVDAERSEDGRTWTTHLLGLAGAEGALPPYMLEELAREDPDRATRRALLTPFHHRATALLFRSVHRCRIPEETRSLNDPWPTRVAALVRPGIGEAALDREVALVLAPLLFAPPSASSLSRALRLVGARWLDGVPISLTQRTGERVPIDEASRSRLGATRLGDTALLGGHVTDVASRATIAIGPVAKNALEPGTAALRALMLTVRWLGDPTTEIVVVARTVDAAAGLGTARLGSAALGGPRARTRSRSVRLDATLATTGREEPWNAGKPRSTQETSCDPTLAHSSNV